MKTKDSKSDALRITDQYRRRPGMVCELQCATARLSVHVFEQTEPDSGWRVEAHSGAGADEVVVARSAPTRAEALREVGAAWAAQCNQPSFDWEAVAALLTTVRAV
jgi:hypothetical protein